MVEALNTPSSIIKIPNDRKKKKKRNYIYPNKYQSTKTKIHRIQNTYINQPFISKKK